MSLKYNFNIREDDLWLEPLILKEGVVIEIKCKGIDMTRGHRVMFVVNNKVIEETSTGSEDFIKNFGENINETKKEEFNRLQRWANFLIEKHSIDIKNNS